ncbi:hypothetical protein VOLCADRAFT_103287 [Volvox carteri f. nagariensis]|uniref:Polysaccharide pyruvyl transferase domain-containing protein n=1 Tax=Volvox carteri f. nagariensis TaxID=3068 RepID=D8TL01_VOLCA|nr:uncharacterized protein VOLCADRAFT_103287 [Volvox carteri f. nagariensis]EFJ51788.1 hypothetical protein VOLCADRAFT_103287 [Volvox carteri f. nagariensis]|eukprot:XP_002947198.1 hypothetical protein VOLCADRAFT_103287 [Volvox carteri f. nagariensis]
MSFLLLTSVIIALVSDPACGSSNIGRLQGLYIGWIAHANLGDELVLDIFGYLLRDVLLEPGMYQRATLEYQKPFVSGQIQRLNFSAYGFAVLGGGSLLEANHNLRTDQCHGVRNANVPLYVHGTGTQLPHLEFNSLNLLCVQPPVWGGVRGPLTNALLANMSQHLQSNITYELPVFGDSGILADRIFPRVSSAAVVAKLEDALGTVSSDGVICISGAVRSGHKDTSNFKDTADLIKAWVSKYIVVLLPVDPETADRQVVVHWKLLTSDPKANGKLFFNPQVTNYGVWLALLSRCDLVISRRLHAAVMAAAVGAPFVVLYENANTRLYRKAKDFVLGTVGSDGWEEFFVRRGDFNGSVAALTSLLDTMRRRHPRQKAAFGRAIEHAHSVYMSSLRAFVRTVIPDNLRSFKDVHIRISRYLDSARFDLSFE